MHEHYTALGWSYSDIIRWGTADLTGKKPLAFQNTSSDDKKSKKENKK